MKFYVDFSATIEIEAKNADEAEVLAYDILQDKGLSYIDVDFIEKIENND